MIELNEFVHLLDKSTNHQRKIIVTDYRGGGIVFWGIIKDFVSLTYLNAEDAIKKIKKNFGFTLENNIIFYRIRSFKPVVARHELYEIMSGPGIISTEEMASFYDPEDPVYIICIYYPR